MTQTTKPAAVNRTTEMDATPSPEALALTAARQSLADAMQAAQIAAVRDVTAGMAKKDAAARHGISRPTLNEAMTWVQPWMWGQPRP